MISFQFTVFTHARHAPAPLVMSAGSLPAANGSAAPQSGVELPEGDEVTGRIVSELPYGYLVEAKVGNHKFSGVLYHSDGEGNAALASNATPESVSKGGSDAAANGGAGEKAPSGLAGAQAGAGAAL